MVNPPPLSAITDPEAEAGSWILRLQDPDCSDEEREAFMRWLESDPRHVLEYRAMLEIWAVSEDLPMRTLATKRVAPTVLASARKRRRAPNRFLLAGSLAAALVASVWIGWRADLLPNSYHRYETLADLKDTTLPDGSRAHLNRGTELLFVNFRTRRQVILREGEVFFDVRSDITHPFEVRAGGARIVVTGTAFNVWKYLDEVAVTLKEGSVQFFSAGAADPIQLSPGYQVRYAHGEGTPLVYAVDPEEAAAWRDGKLVIDDLTLAEALPLINRYLDRPALLADIDAGDLRVGGIFRTNDIEGLVVDLQKVLPVRVAQNAQGNLVITRTDGAAAR